MHWLIFDSKTNKKYIDVKYPSQKKASQELQDLLRPYSPNHEWRRRLFVKMVDLEVESTHAGKESRRNHRSR